MKENTLTVLLVYQLSLLLNLRNNSSLFLQQREHSVLHHNPHPPKNSVFKFSTGLFQQSFFWLDSSGTVKEGVIAL